MIGDRKMLTDPGRGAFTTPGFAYIFAAPTRRQAKRVYWEKLKRDTRLFWDRKPSETELIIYLKNGSQLQVDGLEDPQRIEGQTSPPIKGIHITEMGNVKPDIWDYHIRPLLADNNGFAIIDGTPEGKNHYYRLSLYACGGVIPETKPLDGGYAEKPEDDEWSFHTWFSSDVLPAKEIESARRQMDERSFAQEYEGTFISYDGSLYYNYDLERNTGPLRADLWEPLYLTCDFNKSPMVWEVGQRKGRNLNIIAEISMPLNAKTPATAQKFINRFSHHVKKVVYLTGDPANKYESHRDHSTDYVIIKEVLEKAGWHVVVRMLPYHPSINGRVNITCSMLEHNRLSIDNSCTYLIRDYEECEGDGKGGKDKSDPERTHASDAADYLIWLLYSKEFYKENS
ncbi:MAG: hypothetical protein U5N26_06920 [Candidatus Marinimicrobia bacterium]|nr:hypothetical protein [Candidatus Neomarinimicrobiota bacterium]